MRNAFHHITLQTGDSRLSPHTEARPEIIHDLQPVVARGGGVVHGVQFDIVDRPSPTDAVFDIALPDLGRMVRGWFGWGDPAAMRARVQGDLGREAAAMVPDDAPFLLVWIDETTVVRADTPHKMQALASGAMIAADAGRCFAWALVAAGDQADTARPAPAGDSAAAANAGRGPVTLAVGARSPFPPLPGNALQVVFSASQAPVFLLGMRRPTANQVKGARKDSLQVGLLPHGEHTGFLLLRGSRLAADWMDAPFAVAKLPPEERGLPACPPTRGYLAQLFLIDTRDNTIRGIRLFTLSPDFSQALQAEVARQQRHAATFSEAAHEAEIHDAYARMPRGADMARQATITERAGCAGPFRNKAA